jgi:hypothetical protein
MLFENLAASMSNEIRRNAEGQPFVTGQLGSLRSVLKVRWAWITLPAALVVVSGIFFLLTVIETRKSGLPLWRGSALAVLYHGLETRVRETIGRWDQPSEMDKVAKEVRVKLRREDQVLLLRTGPDKTHSMPLLSRRDPIPSHNRSEIHEDHSEELGHAQPPC